MAITSPAVSSQDAAPITPETITGASFPLSAKEKPLDATPSPEADPDTGDTPLIPLATIPYFRSLRSRARTIPLQPEPPAPQLDPPPGTGSPQTTGAEALPGPPAEQKPAGGAEPVGPAIAAAVNEFFAEEEEAVIASPAEREGFGYWSSGRSQAKRAVEGVEKAIGFVQEEAEDVIGGLPLMEPEKITYWRSERSQAKKPMEGLEKAIELVKEETEDFIGGQPLIEPDKITYWRHPRVAEPAKYTPATIQALPATLKEISLNVSKELEDLEPSVPVVIPPPTYWRHPRVAEPAKYAPAALEVLPATLKEIASNVSKELEDLEPSVPAIIPQATYWRHPRVAEPAKYAPHTTEALPVAFKEISSIVAKEVEDLEPSVPAIIPPTSYWNSQKSRPDPRPPPKAALPPPLATSNPRHAAAKDQSNSSSEYSDYRSSAISFHSSDATLSSGQRRPQTGLRSAVSSPYL